MKQHWEKHTKPVPLCAGCGGGGGSRPCSRRYLGHTQGGFPPSARFPTQFGPLDP